MESKNSVSVKTPNPGVLVYEYSGEVSVEFKFKTPCKSWHYLKVGGNLQETSKEQVVAIKQNSIRKIKFSDFGKQYSVDADNVNIYIETELEAADFYTRKSEIESLCIDGKEYWDTENMSIAMPEKQLVTA